ncbi:MAG: sulfurtransferase TusA family protein [Bacteroidales bacterium OttesenSCG-928-I14]|jgi:sulfite reductase (ferredoxin)|nr:sulfurtransferase TusA family protein [Bacteroidales bacterium OttesenSCG-928-I14]
MYKIPKDLSEDIKRFGILSKKYLKKDIETVQFKSFRVSMGIYEQRKSEVYMIRIRTVGGVIYPNQFLEVINIALRHNSNLLHITTRQELQIQNLELKEIQSILYELQNIGLTTKGSGGNTIRNILVSYNSGITNDEIFDTTSHAMDLTTKLLSEQDSYLLPRKMKIAFSSNDKQIYYAAVNDLGFVAKIKNGEKGFMIYVGGCGGSKPSIGYLLFDFVPESELFVVSEAVKKMFSEYGDRKHRSMARIRYIFSKFGKEKVISIIKKYYYLAKKEVSPFIPKKKEKKELVINYTPINIELDEDYKIWEKRYTIKQKQIGYVAVLIPFLLGDIHLKSVKYIRMLKNLLYFIIQFGNDTVRFTTTQNIQLRNIPIVALPELYLLIKNIVPDTMDPLVINNIVCCSGADICRLGICLSRGLAIAIMDKLKNTKEKFDILEDVRIHISGCHNSCSQQILADIGFAGRILKNNRIYPAYFVYIGANRSNNFNLAELIGNISARDIPEYIVSLFISYLRVRSEYKDFSFYLKNGGKERAIQLLTNYQKIPSFEENENYYFDWNSNAVFSILNKKDAECSAELFDRVNTDLIYIDRIKEILKTEKNVEKINKHLYSIIYLSSRMLLLTIGIDPKTKKDVFDLFFQHFFDSKLIESKYSILLKQAKDNENSYFSIYEKDIYFFYDSVMKLYDKICNSLELKNEKVLNVDRKLNKMSCKKKIKDLRGIVCPMNFVQVKMQLELMQSGEKLEIWIDDGPPINNIPNSIQCEGHQILDQIFVENYWKLVIKKK